MSAVAVLDVPLLRGTTTGSEGSKGLTRRYARSRARRGPSQPPLDFRIPDTRCAPARASIGCGPRLRAIRPRAQAASITPQSHRHLALRRPLCAYPGRIRSTGRVHTRKRLFSLSRFFVTERARLRVRPPLPHSRATKGSYGFPLLPVPPLTRLKG